MSLRSPDTSLEAHDVQMAIWQRLGPAGRVALAVELSDALREITRSGIRARHPAYDESEIELALRRLMWGDALFRAAHPERPMLAP